MPFLSSVINHLTGIPIEDSFKIAGWIFMILFLMSVFTLSLNFTKDCQYANIITVIFGFSFCHIKFPLFFYTTVDVAAYPLMVISLYALVTKRFTLCLLVSSVGLLFKEFLAIPLILLVLEASYMFWRSKSKTDLLFLCLAVGIGSMVVLIPRFFIPVRMTWQFVDPINDPSTLSRLINTPLDGFRWVNIIYGILGYWLPTLLLLTPERLNFVWIELQRINKLLLFGIYLFLVLFLTMYGGTNIATFISYSVAVQVVVLALFYRHGIHAVETIYMILIVVFFNSVFLHVPDPLVNFGSFIDRYGAWSSRVSMTTFIKLTECIVFVTASYLIRFGILRHPLSGQRKLAIGQDSPQMGLTQRRLLKRSQRANYKRLK